MILEIFNKILVVLFMLSLLNVIRHFYYFLQAWFKSGDDKQQPVKYIISKNSLFLLGISLAYVLSSIFIGITI